MTVEEFCAKLLAEFPKDAEIVRRGSVCNDGTVYVYEPVARLGWIDPPNIRARELGIGEGAPRVQAVIL